MATKQGDVEKAAVSSRQRGRSAVQATYADVLAGPVAPSEPSGPLKPTDKNSDPFERGVSMETSLSQDMSGPLSGTPHDTTHHADVAKACLPAGLRTNKTHTCISSVTEIRSFLVWLRSSCPSGLMAQLK